MSGLETSLETFLDALGALERAIDTRLADEADRPDVSDLAEEMGALRKEKLALSQEVDRLKAQNKSLEALTDDVNMRLDGAIEEIRSVLE